MSLKHKICSAFLLLVAFTLHAHSDSFPNHMKDASELTPKIFQSTQPNVLLCVLPTTAGSEDVNDIIGKVVKGNEKDTYLCEYSQYSNGAFNGPLYTGDFRWLDVNYEQLASWLTSLAHVEKNDNGSHYFALRCSDHQPEHPPAICAQATSGKGFEFGYEVTAENGQKSCSEFVGAVYASPFFNLAWNECKGDTFSPSCHQCNGDGCGAFQCSAFTTWDQCPSGSHECGFQVCVGNLCSQKRLCEWDK